MRRLTLIASTLYLAAVVLLAAAYALNPPGAPADHFLAYGTKPAKRASRFQPIVRLPLIDAYEDGLFDVTGARDLLVPANPNDAGIVDAATHLRAYAIKASKVCSDDRRVCSANRDCNPGARCRRPHHTKRLSQSVINELGTFRFDTVKPEILLVPSTKSLTGIPLAPDPTTHEVDHYKCYQAKTTKGAAKFPKNIQVRLLDQFIPSAKVFAVVKPRRLCLPVNKNGEGIKNPQGRLTCYQVRLAAGQCIGDSPSNARGGCKREEDCGGDQRVTSLCAKQKKHQKRTNVQVNNQFGPLAVDTVKETELCIPSISATLPTSTVSTTPTPLVTPTPTPIPSVTPPLTPTPSATSAEVPPDPRTVAPELDPGKSTAIFESTSFLYGGPNSIQTGVASGTIQARRATVLRGRVLDGEGNALSGARVTIKDHPDFGATLSRLDGMFDLVVNGGSALTLNYEKAGYIPSQRLIPTGWGEYDWLPDVRLVMYDLKATHIDLSATDPLQVAEGSTVADQDGVRQAVLVIPHGTSATAVFPSGETQDLPDLTIRITEFTVGDGGQDRMPAKLPPNSGYTYAVELSADQAVNMGATSVVFSGPLVHYVENFLNLPVGTKVPVGAYDREKGAWVPLDDGVVIGIVGIDAGLAELDISGTGAASDVVALTALGVSDAERAYLGSKYAVGQTLWRSPIPHFTPYDLNMPYGPSSDASEPRQGQPKSRNPRDESCRASGSIIDCENQTLGEELRIAGTPFSLHYTTDRMPIDAARKLEIPLTIGFVPPPTLRRISLEVTIAGQQITEMFPPFPDQTYSFVWDGLDAYGRVVQGGSQATIKIGYEYDAVMMPPAQAQRSFARFPSAQASLADARVGYTLFQTSTAVLENNDARTQADLGGWSINVHHWYEFGRKVLFLGDGTRRSSEALGSVIRLLAGRNREDCDNTDGELAINAGFCGDLEVAADGFGNIYVGDDDASPARVWRIDTRTGQIFSFAGSREPCDLTDEDVTGPATEACFHLIEALACDPQGNVYISTGGNKVRKIDPSTGTISTIIGAVPGSELGDEGPAIQASLEGRGSPAMTFDASGNLYLLNGNRLRKVDAATGIISTIAGSDVFASSGDGGPAIGATLSFPNALTLDAQGNIYIAEIFRSYRIRMIDASTGIIVTIAGAADSGDSGDGGLAGDARFDVVESLAVDGLGNLLILDAGANAIRVIERATQSIYSIAGRGDASLDDTGDILATASALFDSQSMSVGPGGTIYVHNDVGVHQIRSPLPGQADAFFEMPSPSGEELYVFGADGRHLRTLHGLTGAVLYEFGYESSGRLATIRDESGNQTTIARNENGHSITITSPFGQVTTLNLDADGNTSSIVNPASDVARFTYDDDGLMQSMLTPRGHTYNFTYFDGLLTRDEDPAGGFQTLSRSDFEGAFNRLGYEVVRSTALGRETRYKFETGPSGPLIRSALQYLRTIVGPDGLANYEWKRFGGTTERESPSRMASSTSAGSDPRFGSLAPFDAKSSAATPGGLTRTTTTGRLVSTDDPDDLFGFSSIVDNSTINGRPFTRTYNVGTRTLSSKTPQNRQATSVIDELGRVVRMQTAGLVPLELNYDERGRLASVVQGSGPDERRVTLDYNSDGFLASLTDPLNRTTEFDYDPVGRVTKQSLPDLREMSFGYDPNGNVTAVTPPGKPVHSFSYTPVDLEATYAPPAAGLPTASTAYTYDNDRQLDLVRRPDGQEVDYKYDAWGGLSEIDAPNGRTSYTYDSAGRLETVSAPGGEALDYTYDGDLLTSTTWTGSVNGQVSRTYDSDFRVTAITVNDTDTVTFGYDGDSLLTRAGAMTITRDPANGLVTGTSLGNVTDSWTYNGFGETVRYTARYTGAVIYDLQLTRDKLGRITQKREIMEGVSHTYDYEYDLAGRLWKVAEDGVLKTPYTYDANGNAVTAPGLAGTPVYDDQDRLLQYDGAGFSYTANGELAARTVAGQTTTYDYDVFGNLRSVNIADDEDVEYIVDGSGRRIGRALDGRVVQGLLYQGQSQACAELNAAGTLVGRFVYVSESNVPAYLSKGGAQYRIITDYLGSPRVIVDVNSGIVMQRMRHDEWGRVVLNIGAGFQPFGFAGGLSDEAHQLVRFGARDYDPSIGRWSAKDPTRFGGGDANLYAYGLGDPINNRDVNGTEAVGACGKAAIQQLLEGWAKFGLGPLKQIPSVPGTSLDDPVRAGRDQFNDQFARMMTDVQQKSTAECKNASRRDLERLRHQKELWNNAAHRAARDLRDWLQRLAQRVQHCP